MKKLIFYLFVLSGFTLYAQEVTFSSGTNYTDYSISGNNSFEASGSGSYFEIGYAKKLGKKTSKSVSYSLSLNLNEYNAASGNMVSTYSWETSYIGIRNGLTFPIFSMNNGLELDLGVGVNLSTILHGQQAINGMIYDVSDHPEFSGLTAWGDVGLNLKYDFKNNIKLAVGYSVSENYSLSGDDIWHNIFFGEEAVENVKLNNNAIKLSLIYVLN